MEPVVISKKLLKRLPMYLAHLRSLPEESNVSATAMAKVLGLGEVMVRKDLAKISETGRRRTGRSRERLIRDIAADGGGQEGLAGLPPECGPGQRCLLPLQRQHQARLRFRCQVHCRTRRLHPG